MIKTMIKSILMNYMLIKKNRIENKEQVLEKIIKELKK